MSGIPQRLPRTRNFLRRAAAPVRGVLARHAGEAERPLRDGSVSGGGGARPRRQIDRPQRRARRSHLILVTPWPPEQSGIADYSMRLARALARSVEVDVVVGGAVAEYEQPAQAAVALIDADCAAARLSSGHDRVLYCMGNSRFHRHVYELLRQHAGSVLLHDTQLTGFFGAYAGLERPEDPLGRLVERVERQYGTLIPPSELRTAPLSWQRRAELGIYMTGDIQRHAERLFVHSRFAQEVVERDRRSLPGRRVPVSVMPFGMPAPRADAVRASAGQPPLVVQIGVLSEVKGLAALIEAFGQLSQRRPGARLALAGPADEAGLDHWRAFAREQAPNAMIDILGYLSRERWEGLLAAADLAVQLRTVSNGEASAAVCDCLAAGVPTIVTDLGWMSELPPSAVVHLPVSAGAELLAQTIEDLIVDQPRRIALSAGALAHTREHSFERVAAAYLDTLALA